MLSPREHSCARRRPFRSAMARTKPLKAKLDAGPNPVMGAGSKGLRVDGCSVQGTRYVAALVHPLRHRRESRRMMIRPRAGRELLAISARSGAPPDDSAAGRGARSRGWGSAGSQPRKPHAMRPTASTGSCKRANRSSRRRPSDKRGDQDRGIPMAEPKVNVTPGLPSRSD